ncbi:MAG TPA: GNAT family N-acetyltransferase [Trinickia sp.]|nr:GNAT family N-acetyltransferase [Trinickia sp.]
MALIRLATVNDIPQMFQVRFAVRENRLAPGIVIPEEDVRHAIEDTGRGWVIEADSQILAFGIADAVNASIWALFVHPDVEGQGYGRRLHNEMVSWLWSRGVEMIWLTTTPGTRLAISRPDSP